MNHKLVLRGDRPLKGTITAQGAKNAALPVMASALLMRNGTLALNRVPDLHDIQTMSDLLRNLGAEVQFSEGKMNIVTPDQLDWATPPALVRKMRASSLVKVCPNLCPTASSTRRACAVTSGPMPSPGRTQICLFMIKSHLLVNYSEGSAPSGLRARG